MTKFKETSYKLTRNQNILLFDLIHNTFTLTQRLLQQNI